MTSLILFILGSIGLTKIVIDGSIAHPFREWVRETKPVYKVPGFITKLTKVQEIEIADLISCPQCCGFWSGIFCGVLTLIPAWFIFNQLLLFAFASSYVCVVSSIFIDYYNALLYVPDTEDQDK